MGIRNPQHQLPDRVLIRTTLLADYEVNYILWDCRQRSIPIILCTGFSCPKTIGSRQKVNGCSNGISFRSMTIRGRDAVEFMLLWSAVVRGYHGWVDGELKVVMTNDLDGRLTLEQHPEMFPFWDEYDRRWNLWRRKHQV